MYTSVRDAPRFHGLLKRPEGQKMSETDRKNEYGCGPDYAYLEEDGDYSGALRWEYMQCVEEGLDVGEYEDDFRAAAGLPAGREKAEMADRLFEAVCRAPVKEDWPYEEPSDLAGIRRLSERKELPPFKLSEKEFRSRVRGAVYGRICGCCLGIPLEGLHRKDLDFLLRSTGNYPISRYVTKEEMLPLADRVDFPLEMRLAMGDMTGGAPADDDLNYVVTAWHILRTAGPDFTSEDVMRAWLSLQGKDEYFTAERAAYRNFLAGYLPPASAFHKNPYREWIGAQIRGDFFGWINPGDPARASEMAFRDARVSHVKNGIYGEMWVAAMLAAAPCVSSAREAVLAGLSCIPATSRLHEAVRNVVDAYDAGTDVEAFFADFRTRWDDTLFHHWCHVISNAEIVAASLLWGGGDYGKTVCMAVSQAFDVDCNGATAGSVAGMLTGEENIPAVWTVPVKGRFRTTLKGYDSVGIDELAEDVLRLAAAGK